MLERLVVSKLQSELGQLIRHQIDEYRFLRMRKDTQQ